MSYTFKVLTPTGEIFFDDGIEYSKIPSITGEIGVLPNHSHMVTEIIPGEVLIRNSKDEFRFFVSKGIFHVMPNQVILFSLYLEAYSEIDHDRALRSKKRAIERKLLQEKHIDQERVRQSLLRAEARLRLIKNR